LKFVYHNILVVTSLLLAIRALEFAHVIPIGPFWWSAELKKEEEKILETK
jgi:hypothetical protein